MHAETIITARSFSGDLCFLGYISGFTSKPGSLEDDGLNKTHELKRRCPVSTASCFELHSAKITNQFRQTTRASKVFLLMESIHTLTDHARLLIQRRLFVVSCRASRHHEEGAFVSGRFRPIYAIVRPSVKITTSQT